MKNSTLQLATAYVVRGLDMLCWDFDCYVGEEEHPHLNGGEVEALTKVSTFLEQWLQDKEIPDEVMGLFCDFCKVRLSGVFYDTRPTDWKRHADNLWDIYMTESFL